MFLLDPLFERAHSLAQRFSHDTDGATTTKLTELDHEHPVALALVRREGNDACQVVAVIGHLLFREEPEDMVALRVGVRQEVEKD